MHLQPFKRGDLKSVLPSVPLHVAPQKTTASICVGSKSNVSKDLVASTFRVKRWQPDTLLQDVTIRKTHDLESSSPCKLQTLRQMLPDKFNFALHLSSITHILLQLQNEFV
jgi:hypothetical protein